MLVFNIGTRANGRALPGSEVRISPEQIVDTSGGHTFARFEIVYATPAGPLRAGTPHFLNLTTGADDDGAYYVAGAEDDPYPRGAYYEDGEAEEEDARFEVWSGSLAAAGGDVHWGYAGPHGPDHWGEIPGFETCGLGTRQSPVDIDDADEGDLAALSIAYDATPLKIKNNGHTIQVDYAPGSTLTLGGQSYKLLQFHFHASSEHTVEGEAFPMEAHLVHANADRTQLVVIGVLVEEGDHNDFLAPILAHMPDDEGEVVVPGLEVNAQAFLPEEIVYYNYSGSLTTSPCSEIVNWVVMEEPVEASAEQIAAFEALSFMFYEGQFVGNARPVQPLYGRQITLSEESD